MKNHFILFYSFLLMMCLRSHSSWAEDNTLKHFETDGCTLFVDGPAKAPTLWRHCCVEHDLRYWFGGSLINRDIADLRLKECVKIVAGIGWAELIYKGVRMGHASPVKNKTQWSWGWIKERKNTALSPSESQYVIEELKRLPMDSQTIEEFINRNF